MIVVLVAVLEKWKDCNNKYQYRNYISAQSFQKMETMQLSHMSYNYSISHFYPMVKLAETNIFKQINQSLDEYISYIYDHILLCDHELLFMEPLSTTTEIAFLNHKFHKAPEFTLYDGHERLNYSKLAASVYHAPNTRKQISIIPSVPKVSNTLTVVQNYKLNELKSELNKTNISATIKTLIDNLSKTSQCDTIEIE